MHTDNYQFDTVVSPHSYLLDADKLTWTPDFLIRSGLQIAGGPFSEHACPDAARVAI